MIQISSFDWVGFDWWTLPHSECVHIHELCKRVKTWAEFQSMAWRVLMDLRKSRGGVIGHLPTCCITSRPGGRPCDCGLIKRRASDE